MTKVTEAHYEIARAMRRHARAVSDALEVSGRVERYHRTDGYREVAATSADPAHVAELERRLRADPAMSRAAVDVHVESGKLCGEPETHSLQVSIWPGRRAA